MYNRKDHNKLEVNQMQTNTIKINRLIKTFCKWLLGICIEFSRGLKIKINQIEHKFLHKNEERSLRK